MSDIPATDLYIQHQVHIAQYTKGEIMSSLRVLERIQNEVIARLNNSADLTKSSRARLHTELNGIVGQIKSGYKTIGKTYEGSASEFVLSESNWQSQTIAGLAEGDVAIISFAEINSRQSINKFEGKSFVQHLNKISRRDSLMVRRAITDGVALGRTNREIISAIQPSLRLGKRDIQTLIRTGIQSNAAAVRDEYFQQNNKGIRAVIWRATLDGRTTVICSTRDGLKYTADEKKPIGHGVPWIGGPPAHFNCRSTAIPIMINAERSGKRVGLNFNKETNSNARSTIRVQTKSGKALRAANKGERLKHAKRMGKGAQYPVDLKFSDWFQQQPAWFQNDYLGVKKAKLFRRGGLPLEKFSEKASRSLTLGELEKLYPKQWEVAFG